jgi:hypothetical protein
MLKLSANESFPCLGVNHVPIRNLFELLKVCISECVDSVMLIENILVAFP